MEPRKQRGTCHGELFFVYDREAMHGEEGQLEEAVLYYYPEDEFTGGSEDSTETQHRIMQMMGSSQALLYLGGEMPTLITLRKEHVAFRHWDKYTLALAGPLSESPTLLQHLLDKIFDVFTFFHGNVSRIRKQAGNELRFFSKLLATTFSCYLPFVRRFGSSTASLFHPLPYVQLPKREGHLFLQACHILQSGQRLPAVLGGAILFQGQVLCTQLHPCLTQHCLSLMFSPDTSEEASPVDHPSVPLPTAIGDKIPSSVRILSVYVNDQEYGQLCQMSLRVPMLSHCNSKNDLGSNARTVGENSGPGSSLSGYMSNSGNHYDESRVVLPPSPLSSRTPSPRTGQMMRSNASSGRAGSMSNWYSEGKGPPTPDTGSPRSPQPIPPRLRNRRASADIPARATLIARPSLPHDLPPSMRSTSSGPVTPEVPDFDALGWRPPEPAAPSRPHAQPDGDASDDCPSVADEVDGDAATSTAHAMATTTTENSTPVATDGAALLSMDNIRLLSENEEDDTSGEVANITSGNRGGGVGDTLAQSRGAAADDGEGSGLLWRSPSLPLISTVQLLDPGEIRPGILQTTTLSGDISSHEKASNHHPCGRDFSQSKSETVLSRRVKPPLGKTTAQSLDDFPGLATPFSPHLAFRPVSSILEDDLDMSGNPTRNSLVSPGTAMMGGSLAYSPCQSPPLGVSAGLQTMCTGEEIDQVDGLHRLNLYVQSHSATTMVLVAEATLQNDDVTIMSLFKHSLSQLGDLEVNLKHALADEFASTNVDYSSLTWDTYRDTLTSVNLPTNTERGSRLDLADTMHRGAGAMHEVFAASPTVSDITLKSSQGNVYGHKTFGQETFFQQRPRPGAMSWPSIEPTTKAFSLEQTAHDGLKEHSIMLL